MTLTTSRVLVRVQLRREARGRARDHLAGGHARRGDVVIVHEGWHHQVRHALGVTGNVDEDEQVAAGSHTQSGQSTQAPHVVDRLPDLEEAVDREGLLGGREELAGLSKVDQLSLVRHGITVDTQ